MSRIFSRPIQGAIYSPGFIQNVLHRLLQPLPKSVEFKISAGWWQQRWRWGTFLIKGATPPWAQVCARRRLCGRSPAVPSRKVAPQKYASSKMVTLGGCEASCVASEDYTIDQVLTLGGPDGQPTLIFLLIKSSSGPKYQSV